MTRDEMITILNICTDYSLEYLESLSVEKLKRIYRENCEYGED